MTCSTVKDLFVIAMLGKLTPAQKKDLKEHVEQCPSCARLVKQSEAYSRLFHEKEMPVPDWDRSWQVIRERTVIKSRRRSRTISVPFRKWAVAAATCCLVFVLGYYIGKNSFMNPQQVPVQSAGEFLRNYTERMELLFIDFSNRDFQNTDQETAVFEAEIISGLLQNTRLLKYLASQKKIGELVTLLEDIEWILVSVSNLRPEDRDSGDQLKRLIKQRSLRNRLRSLSQNLKTT